MFLKKAWLLSTLFSRIRVITAVTLTGMSLSDHSTHPSEIDTHSLHWVQSCTIDFGFLSVRMNPPGSCCIPLPFDRQHYLSCLLGKVFLQNLGLAAGEERGLEEVQQDRKTKQQQRERERKISTKGRNGKLLEKKRIHSQVDNSCFMLWSHRSLTESRNCLIDLARSAASKIIQKELQSWVFLS